MKIYRGKRIDNDEWIYGYYVRIDNDHYIYFTKSVCIEKETNSYENELDHVSVYPETVGQQIGMNDNAGTEVYEGDEIQHYYEESFFKGVIKGTILWDDSDCCFMVQYDSVSMPVAVLDLRENSDNDFFVRGNIYE